MDKDRILAILREHEPELKAAGLLHQRLFGSVAPGDNTPTSDVDLLFDYDETDSWNLLGAYGCQEDVTEILGVKAHLSSALTCAPRFVSTPCGRRSLSSRGPIELSEQSSGSQA